MAIRSKRGSLRTAIKVLPFLLPAALLYAVFYLGPLVQLLGLSLTDWKGLGPKHFVGLENYINALKDPFFVEGLGNNLIWTFAALVIPVMLGLVVAIFISRAKHLRNRALYRTLYFLPQVLSSVVVAIIWRWIYSPNDGALFQLLDVLHLSFLKHGWLGDPNTALLALFIIFSWVHFGFCMIIFIAALQGIDEEYFDAAKVDGANAWQQFRYILVPLIMGPLTTVILITVIASLQVFDYIYMITRGGPMNSTMVISYYTYKVAFRNSEVGYGSALATIMGAFILVFSILFLRVRNNLLNKEASW
jgi:raffinose/stachyose/melibiose transport system permease protein